MAPEFAQFMPMVGILAGIVIGFGSARALVAAGYDFIICAAPIALLPGVGGMVGALALA